jgi:anti-sigma B factor antagonist
MTMQVTIENRSGVHVVRIADERIGDQDRALSQAVIRLIDARGARVVLDLSRVKIISSSGLGEMVTLTARANQYGSQVVLAGPSAFVAGVLETTQLNRFFRVFENADAAVAALA